MFERTKKTIDWFTEHLIISRIIFGVVLFFGGVIFLGVIYDYSTNVTLLVSLFMAVFFPIATTKTFLKALGFFGKELGKSADEFGKYHRAPIERRKRAYDRQIGRRQANRDFNRQEKDRKVSYKL